MPANDMNLEIRRATPDQARALSEIAFSAKAHWGYPVHWMELWRFTLTITEAYIQDNDVYTASLGEQLAGFYALTGHPPRLELDQLWVKPALIGQGVGRSLVEHAIQRAAALGAARIEIQSEPHAEGFYLRLGAKRIGEYVYQLDGQTRILPKMILEVYNENKATHQ